ncbi:hypothetical protein [Bacillus kwashiorkori]|uniref:hypothetical protein n=1 Tax=Bacillus kwashiorkori TaxID=1522318 RepID=UPI0007837E5C|nr:hypothetical protein [Bacillus kwashiorkori]
MSINKYYTRLSETYFLISIYFSVSALVFLLILYNEKTLAFLITVPFSLFSIIYFLLYYYYNKRVDMVGVLQEREQNKNCLLIEQEGNTLYFFNSRGHASCSIQSKLTMLGKKQFLYCDGKKKIKFVIYNKRNTLVIENPNSERLFWHTHPNRLFGEWNREKYLFVREKNNNKYQLFKSEKLICTVEKGLLPLDLTMKFRLNTPVITFYDKHTTEEKCLILLLISLIYL